MKNIMEFIKNPPSKYRPVPFWSWNSKLECDETRWQIDEMKRVGMGGYFMHARGGLRTEYLGDEWMDNVKAAIDEGKKIDMNSWGYDENGWPSGFGSDAVNNLGVKYQQKQLKYEIVEEEKHTDVTVTNNVLPDGRIAHFYYEINPFYVDVVDGEVIDEFIKSTHEKYKKELGEAFKDMRGFFTDEPQISKGTVSWSFTYEEEYKKAYGESLLPKLYDLFSADKSGIETRFKFWKMVTRLFTQNYMGKIYDWCEKNGVELTGHMVYDDSLNIQTEANGATMPHYEYMHIPGVDKLGRYPDRSILAPQVCSVAAQLGKKQVLTESFAMCGWDVSFENLKHIYEWQMVKGVNLLCQHLSGYSLEGIRKRDYPSGHFYQNPWWNDYRDFNDFASRMGMLVAEGEIVCDVLVLHPVTTAWINSAVEMGREPVMNYNNKFVELCMSLDANQILFHLGDDTIMSRHASVEGNKLRVGKMSYGTVIVPPSMVIDRNTFELVNQFSENGGKVIFVGEIPSYVEGVESDEVKQLCKEFVNDEKELISHIPEGRVYCKLCDKDGNSADIQLCYRAFDDFEMYYFVNTFAAKTDAVIKMRGKSCAIFDYIKGETVPCNFSEKDGILTVEHTIHEMGSVVYFVAKDDRFKSTGCTDKQLLPLNDALRGEWLISKRDDNVVTLDRCDVYFDGELYEKKIYLPDIQEIACSYKKKIKIAMDFDVDFARKPVDKLCLVMERPENYTVYINGKVVKKNEIGYYRDKSFKMLDITGLFEVGYNILTLECDFVQRDETYDIIDKCIEFETVKNKLCYDMEIEPVYLVGDFGVSLRGEYKDIPDGSVIADGRFELTKRPNRVNDGDITSQGFPFFCGSMTISKTVTLTKDELCGRSVEFTRLGATVTKLTVNGKTLPAMYWAPYSFCLDGLLVEGENTFEFELVSDFRNMLGPHHHDRNRNDTAPGSFMRRSKFWTWGNPGRFYETYCFTKFGIFLK